MLFSTVEDHGLSQANKAWTEDIHWTVGSPPAAASGQTEVKVPTPTPTAQLHAKENYMASTWWLLEPQTVQANVIGRLIGQPHYPLPSFSTSMRLPDDPAQTGKNTSFSIIGDHTTKHSSTNWPPPVSRHEQNHSLLANHFQIFSNKTLLSKG